MARLLSMVVYTRQLSRMRDFYKAIGLDLIEEKHGDGPQHFSCKMNNVLIEFYPSEQYQSRYRFEFGTKELGMVIKRLILGSFTQSAQVSDFEKRGLHIVDPDGNTVIINNLLFDQQACKNPSK
ncbi:hypothetical protein IPM19_03425 [bacterium]|nr:MAG: hypothetical protein IPM19_03425 [bacterium]